MQTSASNASSSAADARRRFKGLAIGIALVYAIIIVSADGEFWPFSKFPMFSRSGRPWTRAFVTEVSAAEAQVPLGEVWEKEVPGKPFALHHHHINQDDLSAVVRSYKGPLQQEQTDFLATYFDRVRHERTLILYSVLGRFRPDRTVRERFTPIAIIGPEGVRAVVPEAADSGIGPAEGGAAAAVVAPDAGADAGDAGGAAP